MMKSVAGTIIRFRLAALVVIALLTVFFVFQMLKLKVNSDILKSLPDDDPVAFLYKEIGEKYKGNSIGIIILQSDNIYTPQSINSIHRVTDLVKLTQGVETVTSITNIINIKSDSLGIEIGKLVDEYNLPQTAEEIARLKDEINSKDMYKGSIVSDDGKYAAVLFTMANDVNQEDVASSIRKQVLNLGLEEEVLFGGIPMMMKELSDMIFRDMMWLVPIVILVLLVVLFLSFRSLRGVVLPLVSVGIACIWTLGLMSLLGYEITMVGGVIPVVLFAVGSAYSIHVVNHIAQNRLASYRDAVVSSLGYLILPVFLSALTTVLGFVSFIFGSYLIMIKDFGLFCGVGTFISFVMAVVFVPSVMSYLPPSRRTEKQNNSFITHKILVPLNNLLFRHPKYIFTFWIVLTLFGVAASFNIVRSTNIASYFKVNSQTRITEDIMQNNFGGSSPIYILFRGDIQDPQMLQVMLDMEDFIKQNQNINMATSVANLIQELNDAMGEGLKIPDERAKVEQLWFLLEGQDIMVQLVHYDLDEAIMQSRFASFESEKTYKFVEDVEKYIRENKVDGLEMSLSGMPSIYKQIDESLITSQLSSLAIAIVFVLLLVGVSIGSFKLGLFAITPILSAVVALFGFMGISGIHLDIATVLVASVALGIGIDYSIHTIASFNHFIKQSNDLKAAVGNTLLISGKSIVINALTVTSGFLVLMLSQIVPMQYFGLMVALSMIFSATGALTLLPAILIIKYRNKKQI